MRNNCISIRLNSLLKLGMIKKSNCAWEKYFLIILIIFTSLGSSCDFDHKVEAGLDQKTRQLMERLIGELGRQPELWQNTLTTSIRELGDVATKAAKDILSELQTVYTSAVQNTQSASFCSAEYIGIRVKQNVESILHRLDKSFPKPSVFPVICLVNIDKITPGKTQYIKYSGFDFYEFRKDGNFTVDLEHNGRVKLENIGTVSVTTNYQLAVDIQSQTFSDVDYTMGPQLVLKWKNGKIEGKSQLPIIKQESILTIPPRAKGVIGVGMSNGLFVRDTLTSGWQTIPDSGNVIDVAVMPDGRILGVGMSNGLFVRDTLTSGWQPIPDSGNVIAITVMPDGRILGVGMSNGLFVRDTLTSGWQPIPDSENVIAITTR